LEALEEAIARRPEHLAAVRAKAALLVSVGQTNEALALFSKIVADAQAKDPPATNLLTAALSDRSAMLRRMNRIAEAQADWRRAIGVPARSPQTGTNLIDLTDYYNGSLTRGWIPSSQFGTTAERNLGELPQGVQKLGGVSFDVRGVIQLAGHSLNVVLHASFPVQVKGVRIEQQCHRLHFLQGTGWRAPEGTVIGRYVIHYADGRQQAVPLIYGENVRDWWSNPKLDEPTKDAVVAWTGSNPAVRDRGQALRLYKFTWKNPRPDSAIESLDLVSENSNSSPFLIALTVE
jgi:tetratricopeptide (TPR) repeat protein